MRMVWHADTRKHRDSGPPWTDIYTSFSDNNFACTCRHIQRCLGANRRHDRKRRVYVLHRDAFGNTLGGILIENDPQYNYPP